MPFLTFFKGQINVLSGIILVRIAAVAANFLLSWLIVRVSGAAAAGTYYFILTSVTLLASVTSLGLPQVVTRIAATAVDRGEQAEFSIKFSSLFAVTAMLSICISLILFLLLTLPLKLPFENVTNSLQWIAIALPAFSLNLLLTGCLIGIGKPEFGAAIRRLIPQLLAASFLLLALPYASEKSEDYILLVFIAALYFSSVFGIFWVNKAIGRTLFKSMNLRQSKPVIKSASPLILTNFLLAMSEGIDIVWLGFLTNAESVGVYAIAARISVLASFFLMAVNNIAGPKIAIHFKRGEFNQIEEKMSNFILLATSLCIPVFVILALFPELILSIYGPELSSGAVILRILIIGQLFNVLSGPSGIALIMTENTKYFVLTNIMGATVLNCLIWALFTQLGISGAAMASALSLIAINIGNSVFLYRATGIRPPVIVWFLNILSLSKRRA